MAKQALVSSLETVSDLLDTSLHLCVVLLAKQISTLSNGMFSLSSKLCVSFRAEADYVTVPPPQSLTAIPTSFLP
jgi:hypothetical protein